MTGKESKGRSLRRTKGIAARKAENQKRGWHAPPGQYGPVAPTFSPEVVRAHIEQQLCPWCGRGPFQVVALHISQTHGIGKKELRDLAGLKSNDSICAPGYSEVRKRLAVERDAISAVHEAVREGRAVTNPKHKVFTQAGLAALRESSRRQAARINAMPFNPGPKRGGAKRGEQLMKERGPCVICGEQVPREYPHKYKTCSPKCRRELKSKNMRELRKEKFWSGSPAKARATEKVCRNGHERTPENTSTRSDGSKVCLECARQRKAEYRERQANR